MRIIKVADDIFQFAPEHCDGAAFWLRTSAGHLWPGWTEFQQRCETAGCNFLHQDQNGLFNGGMQAEFPLQGGLYELRPALGALRFVFFHPNPDNRFGVAADAVAPMVDVCLNSLDRLGCRFVAMNGIHGLGPNDCHSRDADQDNNRQTLDAIRQWHNVSKLHIQRLYLLDLEGGFNAGGLEAGAPLAIVSHVERNFGKSLSSWGKFDALPPSLLKEHHSLNAVIANKSPALRPPEPNVLLRVLEEYRLGYYRTGQPYRMASKFYELGQQDAGQSLAFGTSLTPQVVPGELLAEWRNL
jgi:hypothetical protein